MTPIRLEDVLKGTGGVRLRGTASTFSGVSTDSRSLVAGQLFWALAGPSFDGHDYVAAALAKGAAGAVIEAGREIALGVDVAPDRVLVAVDDTLRALGDLAGYWRRLRGPKVVAITGSNGKTTTKEMVARVLETASPVLVTRGNLNNLIGMPLTVLGLGDEPVAVLEMGMSIPGEIRRLAEIARPDVALITQVAAAHLEGLGSIDGVAEAKWELFEDLAPRATVILNLDDPKLVERRDRLECRVVTFGVTAGDVHAEDVTDLGLDGVRFTAVVAAEVMPVASTNQLGGSRARVEQRAEVHSRLLGIHNVGNALAAIAVGSVLGVPLSAAATALERVAPVAGRMRPLRLGRDVVVLDDTYNANPTSMAAALRTGARGAGARRRFAALGEMRELGAYAESAHHEVGALVALEGYELLVALGAPGADYVAGALSGGLAESRIRSVPDPEDAAAVTRAVLDALDGPTLVVVKGSRGARMERVVQGLVRELGVAEGDSPQAVHG